VPGIVYASVEEIVRVLTLPTALRFVDHFGGVRVYVPNATRLRDDNPIVKAIGVEAARQVAEEWGENEIMVPRCAALLRAERNRALRADRPELSARQAARKYELTERMVFMIWAGQDEPADPAAEQRELF